MSSTRDRIQQTKERVQARMQRREEERGVLVAEGDSWFRLPIVTDLVDELEDLGYDVESVAHPGDTIESMAYTDHQLDKLVRCFYRVQRKGKIPSAVLLSGGGNDLVGESFKLLLDYNGTTSDPLNGNIVGALVGSRIYDAYGTLIDLITELCSELYDNDKFIPILVHGYAYAVPDGRGFSWPLGVFRWGGPWLKEAFDNKGYGDMQTNANTVATLINHFNDMLESLEQNYSNVRYVDLRDLLTNGPNYRADWRDEIHPTESAFERIAQRFDETIRSAHEGQDIT